MDAEHSPRKNVSSGGPWEDRVAYSRAVRVGPHVWVSGTTAMTAEGIVGRGDPLEQTRHVFRVIRSALREAGAGMEHVVRTRMYVTDASHAEHVGAVHGEVFASIRPVATLVVVRALVDPELLVEIEVDAYVPTPSRTPGGTP
jgi:enamine deaminase RidA (YjgF/YER057c/UK114 family)